MAADGQTQGDDPATGRWIEFAIRLSVLALLLYISITLIRPFLTIGIWSVILTIALYPFYERLSEFLGGRRYLAAVFLTLLCLAVVIGPAAWLAIGLIETIQTLSERLHPANFALPAPPEFIKSWPLIGEQLHQFWALASTNFSAALEKIAPQLRPIGSSLLGVATDAGTGIVKFFIAILIAGFLYPSGPAMAQSVRKLAQKIDSTRGEEFAKLAVGTIRTVSKGVIGISALQAFFAGVGFLVAGIPAATLLTSAVLILGIIQIGPAIVLIPLIIWSWTSMETMNALLFTAYMVPVGLLDNILRPILMGRGLDTPIVVILIGVIGGTISYGITGLFLGPIILAVIWALLTAWIRDVRPASGTSPAS